MKLPDYLIKKYIKEGKIKIKPSFDEAQLRPVGLRLHLGEEIFVYEENQIADLSINSFPKHKVIDISHIPFPLKPGQFILAHTTEKIWTDKTILAQLDGRSTVARLGLTIHNTAQIADGTQTAQDSILLEICNHSNLTVLLHAGDPIASVSFELLAGAPIEAKAGVNVEGSVGWKKVNF